MKKKNSQVFVLENIPYTAGAPVVITSGCLVKDGGSGRLRCQLGMACVNDDPIRAVTVLITPTDADGVTLSGKTEAVLNSREAVAFTAEAVEVAFADGRAWQAEEGAERLLAPPMRMRKWRTSSASASGMTAAICPGKGRQSGTAPAAP